MISHKYRYRHPLHGEKISSAYLVDKVMPNICVYQWNSLDGAVHTLITRHHTKIEERKHLSYIKMKRSSYTSSPGVKHSQRDHETTKMPTPTAPAQRFIQTLLGKMS